MFKLREWRTSDKESLAANANNINIWNNLRDYFPHPYTISDAEAYIGMVTGKPHPAINFTIDINGKASGGIGLVMQQDVERITAEIGYWLGEEFWGKGIMTGAVKQMAAYSFDNFPLQKLFAPVFGFNTASMKVLEKAGFEKEALLKQGAIKNQKIIDLHYYSLFRK